MPDTYLPNAFVVHATNIHTGASDTYGPYAGPPQLTYDLLRANEDYGPPYEIFQFINPQDIEDREYNPHDYDQWEDQEGNPRYDGWRRLERVPHSNNPDITYCRPEGPFYTDLVIEPVE